MKKVILMPLENDSAPCRLARIPPALIHSDPSRAVVEAEQDRRLGRASSAGRGNGRGPWDGYNLVVVLEDPPGPHLGVRESRRLPRQGLHHPAELLPRRVRGLLHAPVAPQHAERVAPPPRLSESAARPLLASAGAAAETGAKRPAIARPA